MRGRFARASPAQSQSEINQGNDWLLKMVDNCENALIFVVNHSVGGGTGSALSALMLERIAVDYRQKSKLCFEAFLSPTISTCVVELCNVLLTTHRLLSRIEISVLLDNEAKEPLRQNRRLRGRGGQARVQGGQCHSAVAQDQDGDQCEYDCLWM